MEPIIFTRDSWIFRLYCFIHMKRTDSDFWFRYVTEELTDTCKLVALWFELSFKLLILCLLGFAVGFLTGIGLYPFVNFLTGSGFVGVNLLTIFPSAFLVIGIIKLSYTIGLPEKYKKWTEDVRFKRLMSLEQEKPSKFREAYSKFKLVHASYKKKYCIPVKFIDKE